MRRFFSDQSAATAIEYAAICAAVVLVLLAGLVMLGNSNSNQYNNVATAVATHM